jgi:L-histidine N-alpha-methyltransferase
VERYLSDEALADQLATDVRAGLSADPKTLPPKYFYDARGSELFDEITRLPEYYPTRTERAILERVAPAVAAATRAETLIELGSGTSEKTRLLLHALRNEGSLRRFVPFDVDPAVLKDAAAAIGEEYPGLAVEPVVGSTIGNLEPAERASFLRAVRATLRPGDAFLLGTDLVKPVERLVAAYDDAAGVTAEFNRNVLAVVNRDLGADFDLDGFDHVAVWDAEHEWIEMRLRARHEQIVRIPALELVVRFGRGEELRTEISAKFRRERVAAELAAAGLELREWWTDAAGDFALSLSVPG